MSVSTRVRNWRTTSTPVEAYEVTDSMLTSARKAADSSWLAQTVWPSRWYGKDFMNPTFLVVSGCAVGVRRPMDADQTAQPLLTVLPSGYLRNQILAKEDHVEGNCGLYCPFEEWNKRLMAS